MWGTSSLRFSLGDTANVTGCIELRKQIHGDISQRTRCHALSCSVPHSELVVQFSSSSNLDCRRSPASRRLTTQESSGIGYRKVVRKTLLTLGALDEDRLQVGVGAGGEKIENKIINDWVVLDDSGNDEREGVDAVEVKVEKTGSNTRKITAKISVGASLEDVWSILTDYERLADFIPGLAVNELLDRRENGCRLYQVGEQDIALGVKFKAKAVVDCEEKPCELEDNLVRRDIDFNTVEGDFQIFKGTWRMEQVSGPSTYTSRAVGGEEKHKTFLSYILDVQPKLWLPVALVEGRLTGEIKRNLVCVRDRAEKGRAL
ncbi:hypothetical protein R1sor_014418 [Riccia sorocarpa]|uniref:Coenzyme Q-binding protein COQ10 START domain-containing protein n=1 Tax=Riccia sorocarpa TaxID=122646 RepID=A0ABD3HC75_9MARC